MFRFEPYGNMGSDFGWLSRALPYLPQYLGYTYVPLREVCPHEGFQIIEMRDKRIALTGGFYGVWSILLLDVYFSNDEKDPLNVQKILLDEMKRNPQNMRDLVSNYTHYIHDQSKYVLKKLTNSFKKVYESRRSIWWKSILF